MGETKQIIPAHCMIFHLLRLLNLLLEPCQLTSSGNSYPVFDPCSIAIDSATTDYLTQIGSDKS